MIIPIKQSIVSQICDKVDIQVNYTLNSDFCDVNVFFKDVDDKYIKYENIRIDGAEYSSWIETDDYLVDLILKKLQLEKQ